MRILKISLLLTALTMAGLALSEPETHLSVSAAAATAAVTELPAGRRPVALPALEYEFLIEFQCPPPMQAESISISVADSQRTLRTPEIDGLAVITSDITVPRQQLSPLVLDGFCQVTDDEKTRLTELAVADAFTAHVSLRCAGEGQQSIHYVTRTLGLSLQCLSPKEDEATIDQGASTSPTER
jgi:hypothetical protein